MNKAEVGETERERETVLTEDDVDACSAKVHYSVRSRASARRSRGVGGHARAFRDVVRVTLPLEPIRIPPVQRQLASRKLMVLVGRTLHQT